ncbi:hypothetical protein JCM19296_3634 [Nonlabens ulvanivorans]|uniref:Uncharacterized protein n=1 Tax=Nonlabens ulvanivorans TaxID=906888 RepID=A0A081DGH9_NONUL|nr:hypothetical protein JCM19296_3634 [Nonlabens ulvanivorans]
MVIVLLAFKGLPATYVPFTDVDEQTNAFTGVSLKQPDHDVPL